MNLLDGITAAAEETGEILRGLPTPPPARTLDEFRTTFAEVERAAEPLLRQRLGTLMPGIPWADEFGTGLSAGTTSWVVDIADGAVQYLRGLPYWCVSITLVRHREPVATVLHHPVRGETYRAERGRGATLDGRPVTPSAQTDLAAALVTTSQPPFPGAEAAALAGRSLGDVLPAVGAVRNLGPTSWQVAEVASGRIDAFWEFGHDDANLAGAALVASEAGATVTDTGGAGWRPGAPSFLAAAPALHAGLRRLLAGQPASASSHVG
ncbi:inositol monophosphatase family protein [Amycolatopsis tucumanensis]|nr:inositol monophosphatase [Amycolatopsis tucumanensis]MCF6425189.1 inositol monophosphatase [Amycolatopsis tucumanensis]